MSTQGTTQSTAQSTTQSTTHGTKSATQTQRARAALAAFIALALIVAMLPLTQQQAIAAEQTVTLIANHEAWLYDDTDTDNFGDPSTDFRAATYDAAAWQSGPSPLGYPTTETSTSFGAVSAGGTLLAKGAQGASSSQAFLSYYFRKSFEVAELANITKLSAKVAIDDGCVIYINGNEVGRINMPAGATTHSSISAETWEATEQRANVTLDLSAYRQFLVEGTNVIAADVHNRDANSSDIYWSLALDATYTVGEPQPDINKTPKQVNVHAGSDPSSAVNVTYTTVAADTTKIVVRKADGSGDALTFAGESSIGSGNKYIHKIAVSGLEANTSYTYVAGNAPTFNGSFKTAPAAGSQEPIKFVYIADTQVSNAANAEALGATLQEISSMNPDFVYMAGDITDNATNETQWEQLFNNAGAYPDGGQNMFGNYLIAAVQGNHDNNTFNRHINAPTLTSNAVENKVVYSFDYGPLTFILLNLEAAGSDATARGEQEKYLRAAVAEAQERGQWTAVGFHKSLITGASHVTDSDVVAARKFWIPIFAELDVDMVLQGHDHVYSRGFVDANGYAAAKTTNENGAINTPSNAPLYMIGGHAGGLKWYGLKNYTVGTGDPLAPGYSYLDIDSANPADNADGIPSDVKQEQVIVEMAVSPSTVTLNTYMFKYDTTTDTITTPKYLYDTMTMVRDTPAPPAASATASITGPQLAIAEPDQLISYDVAYGDLVGANAFDTTVTYNSDELEFVEAASLFSAEELLINNVVATTGQVRIQTGLAAAITQSESQGVVRLTFRAKQPVEVSSTTVQLLRANTVSKGTEGTTDVLCELTGASQTTELYTYKKAADVNKDGKVTLADLSLALEHYQSSAEASRIYDIDLSGVVDALDFVLICSFIE